MRPPSRLGVRFGNSPQEAFQGHTFHNPEIQCRSPGIAMLPPEPQRSPQYWKMMAPHLDPAGFVNAVERVSRCGSLEKAIRASTPVTPYKNVYTQPRTLGPKGESPYHSTQVSGKRDPSCEYIDKAMRLEEEAKNIDPTSPDAPQRRQKCLREASRMYQAGAAMGNPAGSEHLARLRRLQGDELHGNVPIVNPTPARKNPLVLRIQPPSRPASAFG